MQQICSKIFYWDEHHILSFLSHKNTPLHQFSCFVTDLQPSLHICHLFPGLHSTTNVVTPPIPGLLEEYSKREPARALQARGLSQLPSLPIAGSGPALGGYSHVQGFSNVVTPPLPGLLSSAKDPIADRLHHGAKEPKTPRDKTKVVTYRVPHNAAVQVIRQFVEDWKFMFPVQVSRNDKSKFFDCNFVFLFRFMTTKKRSLVSFTVLSL